MTSTAHPPLAGYPTPGGWDEAVAPGGVVRPVARAALDAVGAHDLRALRALVHEETRAAGMRFADRRARGRVRASTPCRA